MSVAALLDIVSYKIINEGDFETVCRRAAGSWYQLNLLLSCRCYSDVIEILIKHALEDMEI